MAAILSTNMASLYAQKNLSTAQASLSTSVQRLSSGTRINSAKDDAAGYGIAESVRGTKNIVDQNIRNAKDGISWAQTAEGALDVVGKILQRSLTLVTQRQDATLNDTQRDSIDAELLALREEIVNISLRTKFQGGGNEVSVFGANGAAASDMVLYDLSGNTSAGGLSSPVYRVDASGNASAQGQFYVINPSAYGLTSSDLTLNDPTDLDAGAYFTYNGNQIQVSRSSFVVEDSPGSGSGGHYISSWNDTLTTIDLSGNNVNLYDDALSYFYTGGIEYDGWEQIPGEAIFTISKANYEMWAGADSLTVHLLAPTSDGTANGYFTVTPDGINIPFAPSSFETQSDADNSEPTITDLNDLILGTDLDQALPTLSSSIFVDTGSGSATEVNATMIDMNALFASEDPAETLATLQDLIAENASNRGTLGAAINSLEYAVDNMQTLSTNLADGISRIVDTDYAAETSNLTRTQIMQQAATSMLAQANQMPNVILTLLK
jgi:flagellin